MKVTSIKQRRAGRVQVVFEGGPELTLATEVVLRSGLQVGAVVDAARIAAFEAEDVSWRAHETALRLLSRRPRATQELRRRLTGKGFPGHVVDETLERLRESGLVDDAGFARELARERIRNRPSGRRALLRKLSAMGVEAGLARVAVSEAMGAEGVSEVDLARRVARRFVPRTGEDARRARERLGAFLSRRGFATDTILQVIEEEPDGRDS